jgi:hypothetical protein
MGLASQLISVRWGFQQHVRLFFPSDAVGIISSYRTRIDAWANWHAMPAEGSPLSLFFWFLSLY